MCMGCKLLKYQNFIYQNFHSPLAILSDAHACMVYCINIHASGILIIIALGALPVVLPEGLSSMDPLSVPVDQV